MQYLKISNRTEIETNAFMLLGACTKRDDSSKIGYFGSGLKYALAVLLREGIAFKVFSGKKEIELTVETEMLRDQSFDVISICGKKTSLTTSMGVDWKPWQAVREIFCNALDEVSPSREVVDSIEPAEGTTAFYIPTDVEEVQYIIDNWAKYFAHDREVLAGTCCKIYSSYSDTVNIYRKGVRCWDVTYGSLYDYDFDKLEINESRTVKYSSEVWRGIARLWGKYATPRMINAFLEAVKQQTGVGRSYVELLVYWNQTVFSDVWREYFKGKVLVPYCFAGGFTELLNKPGSVIVPAVLLCALKKQFGDDIVTATEELDEYANFCAVTPDKRQAYLLKECLQFFEEVKLVIPYTIKVGVFKSKTTLGAVSGKSIILSTQVFVHGKKVIAATILEECAHLDSAQSDDTRGFQDYLVNQIITLLENQYGIFL